MTGPDLQILIRQSPDQRELTFEVRAQDPSLGPEFEVFGPVPLANKPSAILEGLIGDLADRPLQTEVDQAIAMRRLDASGTALFHLLPVGLRDLLWSLQGRISNVQIISEDTYLPWELIKLQRQGEPGVFLCEAFAVTRWLSRVAPTLELPLRSIALVFPRDAGLPSAAAERDAMLSLAGPERRVVEIEATFASMMEALASGAYDGWYFAGHGTADVEGPRLYLEDRRPFEPVHLKALARSLGRRRPLIFLNACATGDRSLPVSHLGSWSRQFLVAGAGAFLGSSWQVEDRQAHDFARAFYERFLSGEPIGEAVRGARLELRARFPGSPAWLSYTVFAHPLAVSPSSDRSAAEAEPPRDRLLVIPERTWRPDRDPPGALLRAEFGIVPFHGRELEIQDLYSWCMDEAAVRIRLYTGPGGMGKTRLALEIARKLRSEGWRAGFLESEGADPQEIWGRLIRPGGRLLIILDYAETRRDLLIPLLRRLYETDGGPIRLILLARAALDWWEQLKVERQGVGDLLSGPATSRHSLAPLALSLENRVLSYGLAAEAFAKRLQRPVPSLVPESLEASLYERVLFLHLAALASIEGVAIKEENGLLDHLLYRERHIWRSLAKEMGISSSIAAGIGRAMAVITLGGGVATEEEAIEVLRQLRFFSGESRDVLEAVARLLHELYPGKHWIEPVLPDLLGEHLVQRELENDGGELLDLVLGPIRS